MEECLHTREGLRRLLGRGSGCARSPLPQPSGPRGIALCLDVCTAPAQLPLLSTFCAETVIQQLAERHVPVTMGAGMGTSLSTLLLITLLGLESLKVSACFLLNVKPPCSSSANTFSLSPASKTQVSRGARQFMSKAPHSGHWRGDVSKTAEAAVVLFILEMPDCKASSLTSGGWAGSLVLAPQAHRAPPPHSPRSTCSL